MHSTSVRDFASTPGQLYCRLSDPKISRTRKGRSSRGNLPLSSFGSILYLCPEETRAEPCNLNG